MRRSSSAHTCSPRSIASGELLTGRGRRPGGRAGDRGPAGDLNCFTDVWVRRGDGGRGAGRRGRRRPGRRARRAPRRARRRQGHHAGRRPPHDARLLRLRALGARPRRLRRRAPCAGPGPIIIGQTTTPEFAHTLQTDSPLWGVTRNPHDLGAHPRRLVGRQRRRRRLGLRPARRGQRHGRLGAHPGGVVRGRRAQAGPRAHPDGRPARAVRLDLPPRPAGPLRRRRPAVPRRHPGSRRRRHHVRPLPARPGVTARRRPHRAAAGALRRPRVLGRRPGDRRRRRRCRRRASRRPGPSSRRSTRRSPAPTRRRGACCGACSWPPTTATCSPSSASAWTRTWSP